MRHGSTGSHDRFNNARYPIVAQPGRCLPHIPKDENNATRGGHNESQRELNQLPGDALYHEYNYIPDDEGVGRGARKKTNFRSLSTLDIGLVEKDSDKKRLLTTVRDNSNNSNTSIRDECGARSLDPNGQVEANSRGGRASVF